MNKNLFTQVQAKRPNKNWFDLTHDHKFSAKFGLLYPTLALECVPGDKFKLGCESIVRFAPLIAPVMHRMDVTTHYFFVPNRLVWPNWEEFITGNSLQGPTGPQTPPVAPTINFTNVSSQVGTLADYMGIPTMQGSNTIKANAIPFAAYQMIYNEYYRDQNLIPELNFELVDGDNTGNTALRALRYRAWEHDYFTSALPWAQKGAAVDIPLAPFGDVPVKVQPTADYPIPASVITNAGSQPNITIPNDDPTWQDIGNQSTLYAETSSLDANPTTINDLRRAFALQSWLEKNARGGTRYIENIFMHFGVHSSDKRLQRPEYIVGVKSPVVVSEVLNTTGQTVPSGDPEGLPQGNMAGHAISVNSGKMGDYYCEEHGYIIGIMSITAKPAYFEGIPKHFLRTDPYDYYWPDFAHLGEQEIVLAEIFANDTVPNQGSLFGYTPRYSEYKYQPNRVSGDFKTTLSYWHLAREFGSAPALSQSFVETSDTPTRIFAVQNGDDYLYCQILHRIGASRPMPFFGTPSL